MINWINLWAKGIILAVIVTGIIEIILPDGNNKKYVKTVIGIYILFVIIEPIISKVANKSMNLNTFINKEAKKINKYEINSIEMKTDRYIENAYKQKIEEDIKNKAKEKKYNVDYLEFQFETEDEERYGEINSIDMNISRFNNQNQNISTSNIDKVEKVEISISGHSNQIYETRNEEEEISNEEKDSFKEYLSSVYGTKKEKIHIN